MCVRENMLLLPGDPVQRMIPGRNIQTLCPMIKSPFKSPPTNIRDSVLPVLRRYGGDEEIESLRESIESGWWGKGHKVDGFEEEFAQMVGTKYAVALTSNTAGPDTRVNKGPAPVD